MTLKVEELEYKAFRKFGEFADLLAVETLTSGEKVQEGFFPDILRLCNNGKDTAASITKVSGNNRTITSCEIHSDCCEGILPLDGDVYIYVAPPFWYLQLDQTRVFRVPKGTMVKLKPGVVHGAPISVSGESVNVLILLPERTYSNDCEFVNLEEKDYMTICD